MKKILILSVLIGGIAGMAFAQTVTKITAVDKNNIIITTCSNRTISIDQLQQEKAELMKSKLDHQQRYDVGINQTNDSIVNGQSEITKAGF